jgi:hypothetical protein
MTYGAAADAVFAVPPGIASACLGQAKVIAGRVTVGNHGFDRIPGPRHTEAGVCIGVCIGV